MLKVLRAGRAIWYAPDQDMRGKDTVFVPFFGVQALTMTLVNRLAERTGVKVSGPTLCRALRRLGLVRKKPSGPRSRSGPSSPRSGRRGAPSWPRSTRAGSSSSTRAGSTPG